MVTLIARNLLQRKNKCKFDSRIKLCANILKPFCSWQREWVVVSLIVVVLVTLGSVVAVVIVVVVTAVVGLMQSIRTMPQSDPNAGESCHKQHINCTQCLPKARGAEERESREGVREAATVRIAIVAVLGHILLYILSISCHACFAAFWLVFRFYRLATRSSNAIDIACSLS